jgi:hypothetical protein
MDVRTIVTSSNTPACRVIHQTPAVLETRRHIRNRGCALATACLLTFVVSTGCAPSSQSSNIQVFSGISPRSRPMPLLSGGPLAPGLNPCAQRTLHTVNFTKKSVGTRLRITYKDTASALATPHGGVLLIIGKIDDVAVTKPTGMRMAFATWPAGTDIHEYRASFTMVGYADGVAQGSHTLAFVYDAETGGPLKSTLFCFDEAEPFLIEVNETQ